MKTYKNTSDDSNVKAYQIYKDAIKIQFGDDSVYLYTYEKNSDAIVETMKTLAASQQGLNTFINTNAKKETAEKLES